MATQTAHLNLIKPTASDPVDIEQINQNMDRLDAAFQALDPQARIPEVADVLQQMDEMEQAASDANAAARNADGAIGYIAPAESSATAASAHAAGSRLIYDGVYYQVLSPIAAGDALTVGANITPVPGGMAGEVAALKNAGDTSARIAQSDAAQADLDVADAQGKVLLRLAGGHIQTRNFDSASLSTVGDLIKESGFDSADLDAADPQGHVILRLAGGHVQTRHFDSALLPPFIEYRFSGDDLMLGFGYSSQQDAVMVLNRGRANGLFDFSALKLKSRGASLAGLDLSADLTTVWISGTDMHSPFEFLAVQDADGVHADATSPGFTGGNHTLDQLGSAYQTASSKYVLFFADGVPVSSGCGKCARFSVRWANEVQAYNTVRLGGGGRACLTEYHDLIFDGTRFSEEIRLVPKEQIVMALWYGLQCVSLGDTYPNIAFTDAADRRIFRFSDVNIQSGSAQTGGLTAWGSAHAMDMRVDLSCDLGKRPHYSGDKGAFVSADAGKGYFTIINGSVTMDADTVWTLRGSYRFYPTAQ